MTNQNEEGQGTSGNEGSSDGEGAATTEEQLNNQNQKISGLDQEVNKTTEFVIIEDVPFISPLEPHPKL